MKDTITNDRRGFLKKAGLGGLSLAAMTAAPIEDVLAHSTSKVNRNSEPTDLKITDDRIAEVSGVVFRTPIVRIYTNKGDVGHGDDRDGAAKEYSLIIKMRLIRVNPLKLDMMLEKMKSVSYTDQNA